MWIWAQFWSTCGYSFSRMYFFCVCSMLPLLLLYFRVLVSCIHAFFFPNLLHHFGGSQTTRSFRRNGSRYYKDLPYPKSSTLKFDWWLGLYRILLQKLFFFTVLSHYSIVFLLPMFLLRNPSHLSLYHLCILILYSWSIVASPLFCLGHACQLPPHLLRFTALWGKQRDSSPALSEAALSIGSPFRGSLEASDPDSHADGRHFSFFFDSIAAIFTTP